MKLVLVFLAGAVFSFGLVISGMHDPYVVRGFLDPFGAWNPALALVMLGAVNVTFVGYRFLFRKKQPLLQSQYAVPTRTDVDSSLVFGAVLFGIGWGLVGLCPGPALVSLVSNTAGTWLFFVAMLLGMYTPRLLSQRGAKQSGNQQSST